MGLEKKDIEMMTISVPTVDYWEMRDDLDQLKDAINRLERTIEALAEIYRTERVKNWSGILDEMLRQRELKKGKPNVSISKQ